jgi:flavin-binding protein dodecin
MGGGGWRRQAARPARDHPPGSVSRQFHRFQAQRGEAMSVARITEISATSTKSFEDAVTEGISRASKTLRGVTGAWVKEQKVHVKNGKPTGYQVNMMVTFVLDD